MDGRISQLRDVVRRVSGSMTMYFKTDIDDLRVSICYYGSRILLNEIYSVAGLPRHDHIVVFVQYNIPSSAYSCSANILNIKFSVAN